MSSPHRQQTAVWFAGGGTGGHLYPGLAIARALTRLSPAVRPLFIGAQRGIERDVLPQQGFSYELLELHPLYRPAVWRNWRTIGSAAGAWRRLGALARADRPGVALGTGGYASALTLAYAATHHIPIVQQVADSTPGLTARWFARSCREIYLGYPEAAARLATRPGTSVLDTGNPIEPPPSPRPDSTAARAAWGWGEGKDDDISTVMLVFGGSQGARPINAAVDDWLARGIPATMAVIWATGRAQYATYATRESARVKVRPYLAPIGDAYAASDLALTRAGAMTTAELCAWGIPMVLVPLPTAAADHQTANAQALADAGAAVHLPQAALSADAIGEIVGALARDANRRAALAAAALRRGRPAAAEDIARRILSMLHLT